MFGYRSEFLTDTHGEGIMSSVFEEYQPYKGEIASRSTTSLVSCENGEAVPYGMNAIQDRGELFVDPGTPVYIGMVVGICSRSEDIDVNICKQKHLTNFRMSSSEDAIRLKGRPPLSLEEAMEFISDDELVEITPSSIRVRKTILDMRERLRARARKKNAE
jgi:GTP-binding protein